MLKIVYCDHETLKEETVFQKKYNFVTSIKLKGNSNKKKSFKKNNGRKYSCRKDIVIHVGDNLLLKDSILNVLKSVCEYILKEFFTVFLLLNFLSFYVQT